MILCILLIPITNEWRDVDAVKIAIIIFNDIIELEDKLLAIFMALATILSTYGRFGNSKFNSFNKLSTWTFGMRDIVENISIESGIDEVTKKNAAFDEYRDISAEKYNLIHCKVFFNIFLILFFIFDIHIFYQSYEIM